MQFLRDIAVTPRQYSMFSSEQCPRALALMAGLADAAGRRADAGQWLVELIGAIVLAQHRASAVRQSTQASGSSVALKTPLA